MACCCTGKQDNVHVDLSASTCELERAVLLHVEPDTGACWQCSFLVAGEC